MTGVFKQLAKFLRTKQRVSGEDLESVEELLLRSDIGVAMTSAIVDAIAHSQEENSLYDVLARHLRDGLLTTSVLPLRNRPDILVFLGVNGSGKTTSIAKIAALLRRRVGDIGIVFAAADTFRAAAREQLALHAKALDARLVTQDRFADPASVVFDAIASAKSRDDYVVLVDTAGRMHTNKSLIEELKKIKRVVAKHEVEHRTIFTLDANTGNNALAQIEEFHRAVGIDAVLLTKLDSAASGGVLFPLARRFAIPCIGLGLGEGYDDFREFDSSFFVSLILQEFQNG